MPTDRKTFARRLEGKVAVVTGASRGIGRAIALRLAAEGARVVVNYRSGAKAAGEVVAEIQASGEQGLAVQADVGDQAAAVRLLAEALEHFGRVDALVNNAGILYRSSIAKYDADEFLRMQTTNVNGVTNTVAAVSPIMQAQKSGSIVNITSVAALGTAAQGTTFYAATKAAVSILTKRFALELGPYGITVNAVAPGFIITDMTAVGRTADEIKQLLDSMASRAMLGRAGTPDDISAVVAFLASSDAGFMTGQILTADGGRMDFLTHGQ
jgi:3-oxoacyl-[acyl-carrier protein] reductase